MSAEPSAEAAPFEYPCRVRFHHIDRAGILFYGTYFTLAHDAYEEFIRALGFEMDAFFDNAEWVVPLVHAEADYHRPTRHDAAVVCEVGIERLGASSMTLVYRFRVGDVVHATLRTVHAFVDRATFVKRSIPEDVRAVLTPVYERGAG